MSTPDQHDLWETVLRELWKASNRRGGITAQDIANASRKLGTTPSQLMTQIGVAAQELGQSPIAVYARDIVNKIGSQGAALIASATALMQSGTGVVTGFLAWLAAKLGISVAALIAS